MSEPTRPALPGRPAAPGHVPELDGVRGLAIAGVLLWHLVVAPLQGGAVVTPLRHVLRMTGTGVDLFFVLSGFLIGGILLEHRDDPRYFRTFYLRRACRILPLYLGLLAAVAIAFSLLAGSASEPPWLRLEPIPWWSYLLFTQNIVMAVAGDWGTPWLSATWSLAVEEQFYLLLPALVRVVPVRRFPHCCAAIALAAPLFLAFTSALGFASYVSLATRADSLMIGAGLAWLWRSPAARVRLRALRHVLRFAWVALFVAGSWLSLASGLPDWAVAWRFHVLAWAYGGLVLLVLVDSSGLAVTAVRSATLRWLGRVAFGAYLLHQPVQYSLHWLFRRQLPTIAGLEDGAIAVLAMATTLALAELSWRFVESPFIRLGRRAGYSLPPQPAMAGTVAVQRPANVAP
jgi:peptidoglycan/LPS O-acetylase OafA/YrhL